MPTPAQSGLAVDPVLLQAAPADPGFVSVTATECKQDAAPPATVAIDESLPVLSPLPVSQFTEAVVLREEHGTTAIEPVDDDGECPATDEVQAGAVDAAIDIAAPAPPIHVAASAPTVASPKQAEPAPPPAEKPRVALPTATPRPDGVVDPRVDITQITHASRETYMAQLHEEATVRLAVRASGEVIGMVEFQVSEGHIAVHIGQVLDLFRDRMDAAHFAALRGSPAARRFVPLEAVRVAGVPLKYDAAYDELVLADASS